MSLDSEAERLWRAARALSEAAGTPHLPPLLFFTDPERTPEPWRIAARLPTGAGVVYRGFGRPGTEIEARRLREATRAAGVRLLIGRDVALAEAVGADGVHLPEAEASRATDLRSAHPDWMLTAARHPGRSPTPPEATGLDAWVVSPVFAPGGVSGGAPLGGTGLAAAVREARRPCYALGGLDGARAETLTDTGACGIAAVEAVLKAWGGIRT